MAQSPRHTVAQSPRYTVVHSSKHTVAQSPRYTQAQALSDRHLLFLGNLLGCPPTSRLRRPRLLLLVRVGGPNATAAWPYPALRLDKLYAAWIRCLVLWTVTKQFLGFLFYSTVFFGWWVRCDP